MKRMILLTVMLISTVYFLDCSEKQRENPKKYGTVIGTIIDGETEDPIPARVYAISSEDSIYLADDCLPYERPNFGPRIGYTGRHFTTIGNIFTVYLPEGTAMIKIERGKEYIPIIQIVEVTADETTEIEFTLHRWIDMSENDWYSGDLHVHRNPEELVDLLLAEDLNVATVQTNWGYHEREPDFDRWLEKADGNSTINIDDCHVFSVLSHEIERFNKGAVLMHHTGKTIIPVHEYHEKGLPTSELMKKTRDAGGYNDIEKPWWPETHIDVASGMADFVGLANKHNTYKSYLPEHPRHRTEYKDDYPEDEQGYVEYVCDLYYAYLNCGFKLMPSAGSASGVLPNPLGYNRVYVKVDGEFSYDNWFAALKSGCSFVTNGPMLIMTVDGRQMGETIKVQDRSDYTAHVACTVNSLKPIGNVEIIHNGKIVYSVEPELSDNTTVIETNIFFSESGWIVVRCFEKIKYPSVQFAHTAPVFIKITDKPFKPKRYAAEYFLRKTNEVIAKVEQDDTISKEAKKANMDVYRKAAAIYKNLIK